MVLWYHLLLMLLNLIIIWHMLLMFRIKHRAVAAGSRAEHHLHILHLLHLIIILHDLHLILHQHPLELSHILHLILRHWQIKWRIGPKVVVTVSIWAIITEFAKSIFLKMLTFYRFIIWTIIILHLLIWHFLIILVIIHLDS